MDFANKDLTQESPMKTHSNNDEESDCVEPIILPYEEISYMSQREFTGDGYRRERNLRATVILKARSSISSKNIGNCLPSKELLDDLYSRFVLNVPEEDQQSFERILFLVEYAYWYYEDNAVENDPTLKSLTLKEFTSFNFTSYKCRVPVNGAIILDETYERCLLVKGWKGSSWSFPCGKKSKDKEDHACAICKVLEETGFDVSKLLKKEEYIEFVLREQRVRLYIVAGVTDDTAFAPLTKKEISETAWHRLDHLQPATNEVVTHGVSGLKLYMVAPFLASLKLWISEHPLPIARKRDIPLKGRCVWNARTSSGGNGTTITEKYNKKPEVNHLQDTRPGNSLRTLKFNTSAILQAMESGFSA